VNCGDVITDLHPYDPAAGQIGRDLAEHAWVEAGYPRYEQHSRRHGVGEMKFLSPSDSVPW
jgi:hypothetical protein